MVGWQEIGLIALIALLFFGPTKVPELARAFGKAHTSYKKGIEEVKDSFIEGKPLPGAEYDPALTPEEIKIIKAAKTKNIPTDHRSIDAIAQDLLNAE